MTKCSVKWNNNNQCCCNIVTLLDESKNYARKEKSTKGKNPIDPKLCLFFYLVCRMGPKTIELIDFKASTTITKFNKPTSPLPILLYPISTTQYLQSLPQMTYCFPVQIPVGGLGPPESAMLIKDCIVIKNADNNTIPPMEKAIYEFL